mgnify:CR=1 FL=1
MAEILLKVSVCELCQIESINEQIIIEAVNHGIAKPLAGKEVADWVFDTNSVHWLKKAIRLHQDLEIEWIAVAILIDLLQHNESLERENRYIHQQLQRFLQQTE